MRKNRREKVNTKKLQVFVTEENYQKLKEKSKVNHISIGQIIDDFVNGDSNLNNYISAIGENLNFIHKRLVRLDRPWYKRLFS